MATKELVTIDTHCHLDLYANPKRVIRQVVDTGTYTIAVTNTPAVAASLVTLAQTAPRIRVALGLHPELAVARRSEMSLFRAELPSFRYIGEIGLDFTTQVKTERRVQVAVFEDILSCCDESGDKILTIHSRRAADAVIDAIGTGFRGGWILHWYSGSARALHRAIKNGAYVSVNPAMMRSQSGRRLLAIVPPERILTETDGPFVEIERGVPATPADVPKVLNLLANLWAVDLKIASQTVFENFRALLESVPNPEMRLP